MAWQIVEFQARAQERGYSRYESAQMNYSLLNRDIEQEEFPYLKYSKMTLLAWSPLHGDVFTGKYKKGEKPPKGSMMGDGGLFYRSLKRTRAGKL